MSFQQSPKKLPSLNVNTSSMSTQSGLSRGSLNEVKPCALVLYPNGQDAMGPRASPKSIPSIKITKFQKGLFGEVTVSGTAKKSVGYIQSPLNVNNPFVVNYGGLLSPQNRLSINGVKPESFSTDKQASTNDITASSNRRSAKVQSLIQPKLQHSPPLAPTNSVFEKSGTLPTSGTNLLSPVYKQAMGRTIMRVERLIKKQCQNIVKLTEKKGSDVEVAPNLKMIAPLNTQKFTLSGISSIQNIDTSILQEASVLENNSPVTPVKTQESHVHWINESLIRRGPSQREKEESEGTICQDISSSRDTRQQLKEHMNLLDSSISTCSSHSVTEQASLLDFEFDKQKQITKIPLENIDRRFSEHINNSVRRMSGGVGSDFRFITEEDWNKKSPKGDGLYVDSEILTPVEQKENSMKLSKGKNINNILTPEITNPWNSPKIPSNKILVRIIKSIKHLPDTREQNALHAISQESPKKLYTMISHKHELSKNSILADQHKTLNNEDGLKKLREIKKINLANIHNQKPRAPIRQIL